MGCCLFLVIFAGAPRMAFLLWWLFDSGRISTAFDTFLVPALGLVFLPWTTLMYVLVSRGGVIWFDWIWLGLALLADLSSYGGGYYGRPQRGGAG